MNSRILEGIKVILREKSGKKLALRSVIAFLLVTVIVFFAVFSLFEAMRVEQMSEYLEEIPGIIENRENELLTCSHIYEGDILARAELGLILSREENVSDTEEEMLERVRGAVSADSVSLVDGQGELIATTGPASPEETFRACIRKLEPRQPELELYSVLSGDGKETGKKDGKGFVKLPVTDNAKRSLVFEFPCDAILELHNTSDDWTGELERILSGGKAVAFVKTGDKLASYPTDILTGGQAPQLSEELEKVFQSGDSFRKTGKGTPVSFIKLQGRRYLAALMKDPEQKMDVLIAYPLQNVIGNGIFIAAAISVLIGWGIVLLQIYIFCRLLQREDREKKNPISIRWVCRVTVSGVLVLLAATFLFSYMLLELENRMDSTFTAVGKRTSLQYEIDLRKSQEDEIRGIFVDLYRSRTQMLAGFLAEHPDYQTRAGLSKLNAVAGTEYLMRFDSAGQELVSSNSYTGFAIDKNLSEEYRAVLLGYPDAVVGPAEDAYTGKSQLGAAILMKDGEGQADGFLLAVYSAGDLKTTLKRLGYENAVNSFAVQKGHIAAAVSDETGCFIAHTDPKMIGQKAENVLEDYEPGASFEGFSVYNGKQSCVSASAADGRTLLFIVPQRDDSYMDGIPVLVVLAGVLILTLLYYPSAGLMIARAMEEAKEKLPPSDSARRPMKTFSDGYSIFLTLFAVFVLIASANGWWTTFDYVFSGRWSRGLHLYSAWAALFVLTVTLCCVILIRHTLGCLEKRLSTGGRTVARLVGSLIGYVAVFFLIFSILGMVGVDTKVLLASAGVVSIAVGMGSQSMASDLLAGFFMMLEGSIHVGDQVTVGGSRETATGKVVDMGVRTIKILEETGNLVTMNNSKATPIKNLSQGRELPESEDKPEDKPEKKQENGSQKAD